MFKRWLFAGLFILGLMLTDGPGVWRAEAYEGHPCRRLYGTEEWTRRCAERPQQPGEDFHA